MMNSSISLARGVLSAQCFVAFSAVAARGPSRKMPPHEPRLERSHTWSFATWSSVRSTNTIVDATDHQSD